MTEMSNLNKDRTGIDYPIWIGNNIGSHGPRIKVSNIRGKMNDSDVFAIQFSKSGELEITTDTKSKRKISNKDLKKIYQWIRLNLETLMSMWYLVKFNQTMVSIENDDGTTTDANFDDLKNKLISI